MVRANRGYGQIAIYPSRLNEISRWKSHCLLAKQLRTMECEIKVSSRAWNAKKIMLEDGWRGQNESNMKITDICCRCSFSLLHVDFPSRCSRCCCRRFSGFCSCIFLFLLFLARVSYMETFVVADCRHA